MSNASCNSSESRTTGQDSRCTSSIAAGSKAPTSPAQLAGDAGFNGVNLLANDTLTVNFNEDGSSNTSVTGVDYTNANAAPYTAVPSAKIAMMRNMSGEARGTINTTVI